jgi:hypothetical protein
MSYSTNHQTTTQKFWDNQSSQMSSSTTPKKLIEVLGGGAPPKLPKRVAKQPHKTLERMIWLPSKVLREQSATSLGLMGGGHIDE